MMKTGRRPACIGAIGPPVLTVLLTPWGWAGAGIEYVVRIQPSPIRMAFTTFVYLTIGTAAILLFSPEKSSWDANLPPGTFSPFRKTTAT